MVELVIRRLEFDGAPRCECVMATEESNVRQHATTSCCLTTSLQRNSVDSEILSVTQEHVVYNHDDRQIKAFEDLRGQASPTNA